jgi:hypothetical protein
MIQLTAPRGISTGRREQWIRLSGRPRGIFIDTVDDGNQKIDKRALIGYSAAVPPPDAEQLW